MKTKIYDSFVIGIVVGSILHMLLYLLLSCSVTKTPENVSSKIDKEYYLEVSEDSIWIENTQSHRVYGGTYTQLDSLINIDNL
jgi:hypothetical protein